MMVFISILAGSAIALQGTLSSRLGELLNSPILATFFYFLSSTIFLGGFIFTLKSSPLYHPSFKQIPLYYWILGGLLSSIALSTIYWQVPKIGLSKAITGVLVGQILTSSLLGHLGAFSLPKVPLTTQRLLGFSLLIISTILINKRV